MINVRFGNTGLTVSRLCIGTGRFAERGVNLSETEGGDLLKKALDLGVTFWDTAQSYGSYRHIREGLKGVDRSNVVINTKTAHKDYEQAMEAVEEALREMKTDYIDSICLHGVSSTDDLNSRQDALDALLDAKEDGLVQVVGITSHLYTGGVMEAAINHPDLEFILSLGSKNGLGLLGGTMEEHASWLKKAANAGMGCGIFKVLAAGKKADDAEEWIRAALKLEGVHTLDIGMVNEAQLEMNCLILRGEPVPQDLRKRALEGAQIESAHTYPRSAHGDVDIEAAGEHVIAGSDQEE